LDARRIVACEDTDFKQSENTDQGPLAANAAIALANADANTWEVATCDGYGKSIAGDGCSSVESLGRLHRRACRGNTYRRLKLLDIITDLNFNQLFYLHFYQRQRFIHTAFEPPGSRFLSSEKPVGACYGTPGHSDYPARTTGQCSE
jgi:hypothetical protein